jgi:type VI secretion system protein ImpH
MEYETGSSADTMIDRLKEKPYEFDFFQAVRRLECALPDKSRVGFSKLPKDDPVRFSQKVSLAFRPSAIEGFDQSDDERASEMTVSFLGLLGCNGPMPLAITEYIQNRALNHGDTTLTAFLNVFNHRMISFFYRAWASSKQTVSHDRKDEDRFAAYFGSLLGIGAEAFADRDAVVDTAKLHFSGRLACQSRSAEGLKSILQDYFEVPVAIEEMVGQWVDVPDEYLTVLGGPSGNTQLGVSVIVGSRIWDCQRKFRIVCGAMEFDKFQRFLPGHEGLPRLVAWVRNYIGDELEFEVQLILKKGKVPPVELGKSGQLGWTAWLGSKPRENDADEIVLTNLINSN